MLILTPIFFLWNITGDTLIYHQHEQCATVTGNPEARDDDKEHVLKADVLKANMSGPSSGNVSSQSKRSANEIWANGHVHFTTKELDVTADKAYFHPSHHTVELEGNVIIKHKKNEAWGDRAIVDLTKQTYTLHKVQGRMENIKDLKKPDNVVSD